MSDGEACAARFMFNFVRRLADIVVFTRQLLFELFELGLGWFFFFFFFPLQSVSITTCRNLSYSMCTVLYTKKEHCLPSICIALLRFLITR